MDSGSLHPLPGTSCVDRRVTGGNPLLLDDPSRCVLVRQGTIDLFWVALRDGRPWSVRHYIASFREGDLLFGVDGGAALTPIALVALGGTGTIVAELERAEVESWATQPASADALAGRLENWVSGLSDGMRRPIQPCPRADTLLAAGKSCDVAANRRLSARNELVWLDVGGAAVFFLDTDEITVPPGGAIPLAAGAWLSLYQDGSIACHDTRTILAQGRAWPALDLLHEAMLDILPLNLHLLAADETNQLRRRGEADRLAGETALALLAAPFGGNRRATAIDPAMEPDADPLLRAARMVARALNNSLAAPPRRQIDGEVVAITLEEIARVNQMRLRDVLLEEGWWKSDVGPLLLSSGTGPQAVLPMPGGYALYDPADESVVRLTAAQAGRLEGKAFSFYFPFPARALRGLDIGGGIFRWCRRDSASMVLLGLASGLLGLGAPIVTAYMADTLIPTHDRSGLWQMAAVLAILAVTGTVLRYGVQIAAVRIEGRAGTRIQAAVMDRLLRLPIGFFKTYESGDLATRALAIQAIEHAVGGAVIGSLTSGLYALVSVFLMGWYSLRLTAVALALVALIGAMTAGLGLARIRIEATLVHVAGRNSSLMLQLATGIGKLRLAAAEPRAFLRWARLQSHATDRRLAGGRIGGGSAAMGAMTGPLATAIIFAIVFGTDMAAGGKGQLPAMTLGSLLAFLSAFSQTLGVVTGLVGTALQMASLKPVYARAKPILDAVPETTEGHADPGPLGGTIDLSHVTFRYGPDLPPIFSDLTLSIEAGEYVAIVGPSGSGKSSIVRLLLGFETPSTGAVLLDKRDLRSLDLGAARRQMGVVLQGGRLMPTTLLDNILGAQLGLGEADAWEAARQVGLDADIRAMPMGMQTLLSDGGGALSGGQAQRVLLARALVGKPSILLLDEATSALDNRTQAVVTESLDRLTVTRVVIAHRLSTVVNADRIIVLAEGGVAESGRYEDLLAAGGTFAQLASRQLL